MARINRKTLLPALALTLLVCAAGLWFFDRSGFLGLSSLQELQVHIQRFAPYSHAVFFLLQFFSVVLAPIPSNISAAAGGVLFGTWPAFFLTFSAVFLASLLVFALARALGRAFVDRLVNRRLSDQYQAILRKKGTTFLALAFLLPYFPDDILCILAGLSPMTPRRFSILLVLTRPWGLLFASALGGSFPTLPLWALLLIGLCGISLFCLGMRYGDRLEQAILSRLNR